MQEIENLLKRKFMRLFQLDAIEENSRLMVYEYFKKAQELFNNFSSQPELKVHPEISICITNPLSLNAFIAKLSDANHFLIGLSYGLFANLYACFMGLLSHPDVLPNIGDSSN